MLNVFIFKLINLILWSYYKIVFCLSALWFENNKCMYNNNIVLYKQFFPKGVWRLTRFKDNIILWQFKQSNGLCSNVWTDCLSNRKLTTLKDQLQKWENYSQGVKYYSTLHCWGKLINYSLELIKQPPTWGILKT